MGRVSRPGNITCRRYSSRGTSSSKVCETEGIVFIRFLRFLVSICWRGALRNGNDTEIRRLMRQHTFVCDFRRTLRGRLRAVATILRAE